MKQKINLHNVKMNVVETAGNGVVNHETIFKFNQTGERVIARYSGGGVERGLLVGEFNQHQLQFRYAQEHSDGNIAGGKSVCDISISPDGSIELIENFNWEQGTGKNVFRQIQ